jgi:hypothetical protein
MLRCRSRQAYDRNSRLRSGRCVVHRMFGSAYNAACTERARPADRSCSDTPWLARSQRSPT